MTRKPTKLNILALFGARSFYGQERANLEALVALREAGCTVTCAVRPQPWTADIASRVEKRGIGTIRVPFVDFPTPRYLLGPIISFIPRMLSGSIRICKYVKDNEVTHFHLFNQQVALSFLPALLCMRLPVIYRAGDKPITHRWYYRFVWWYLTRRVAIFVADSEFIKKELIDHGVACERISVLRSPPPERGRSVEGFEIEDSERVKFVFVGRITSAKGAHHVVEAFAQTIDAGIDAELYMAGEGDHMDPFADALKARIAQSPQLASRVRFMGVLEDVPRLMESCDVHLAPSTIDEAYGLVVIEAKTASIPSIIYESGGMTELVRHNIDGMVCAKGDLEGLARSMLTYAESTDLRKEHGLNANRSLLSFDFPLFKNRWLEAYLSSN